MKAKEDTNLRNNWSHIKYMIVNVSGRRPDSGSLAQGFGFHTCGAKLQRLWNKYEIQIKTQKYLQKL